MAKRKNSHSSATSSKGRRLRKQPQIERMDSQLSLAARSHEFSQTNTRLIQAAESIKTLTEKRTFSIDQLRDVLTDIKIDSDDMHLLNRFTDYAKLFHPTFAAILAEEKSEVWKKADKKQIEQLFEELDLTEAEKKFEREKFDTYKKSKARNTSSEIEVALGKSIPKTAITTLKRNGIYSFYDARRRLFTLETDSSQKKWKKKLSALVSLSYFIPDIKLAQQLLEEGYESVYKIATLSTKEFDRLAKITKQDTKALKLLRQRAQRVQKRLTSSMTAVYINHNQLNNEEWTSHFTDLFKNDEYFNPPNRDDGCGVSCSECDSALSLFAYLVDLIDFSAHHYGLGVVELEETLHRGLNDIDVVCDSLAEKVPLVLIGTEILERYILVNDSQVSDVPALQSLLADAQQDDYIDFVSRLFSRIAQFLGTNSVGLRRYIDLIRQNNDIASFDRDLLAKEDFRLITGINETESDAIWTSLYQAGLIDKFGRVTSRFRPEANGFSLSLASNVASHEAEIIQLLEVARGNDLFALSVDTTTYSELAPFMTAAKIRQRLLAFETRPSSIAEQNDFVLAIRQRQASKRWLQEDRLISAGEYSPEQLSERPMSLT
jgi:hypothetical protein